MIMMKSSLREVKSNEQMKIPRKWIYKNRKQTVE